MGLIDTLKRKVAGKLPVSDSEKLYLEQVRIYKRVTDLALDALEGAAEDPKLVDDLIVKLMPLARVQLSKERIWISGAATEVPVRFQEMHATLFDVISYMENAREAMLLVFDHKSGMSLTMDPIRLQLELGLKTARILSEDLDQSMQKFI